jgi:biotin operon repressor
MARIDEAERVKDYLKFAILHQLGQGEQHAIHKQPLAKRLGVHERIVRETIVEMRHTGIPIIGSQKGYYLAADIQDIQKAREYIKSYVKMLCRDMADYKRLINQINGQFKMRF